MQVSADKDFNLRQTIMKCKCHFLSWNNFWKHINFRPSFLRGYLGLLFISFTLGIWWTVCTFENWLTFFWGLFLWTAMATPKGLHVTPFTTIVLGVGWKVGIPGGRATKSNLIFRGFMFLDPIYVILCKKYHNTLDDLFGGKHLIWGKWTGSIILLKKISVYSGVKNLFDQNYGLNPKLETSIIHPFCWVSDCHLIQPFHGFAQKPTKVPKNLLSNGGCSWWFTLLKNTKSPSTNLFPGWTLWLGFGFRLSQRFSLGLGTILAVCSNVTHTVAFEAFYFRYVGRTISRKKATLATALLLNAE